MRTSKKTKILKCPQCGASDRDVRPVNIGRPVTMGIWVYQCNKCGRVWYELPV